MINKDLIVFKNLAIYLIEGESRLTKNYASLEESMDKGFVTLYETGNVGELSIDNNSDHYVFIMAGDIVKGGRQDRTLAEDVILKPAAKNVPLKSFCVESQRWGNRGSEDVVKFACCKRRISHTDLRMAVQQERNQGRVWEEVERYQLGLMASPQIRADVRSRISPSSLLLTLDSKEMQGAVKDYLDALNPAFEGKNNVLGFSFAVNGRFSTMDAFGSAELFAKFRNKLLEAAAGEAITNLDNGLKFENPTAVQVEKFISEAQEGRMSARNTGEITLEKRYETQSSVEFDTFHVEAGREEKVHSSVYNAKAQQNI